MRMLLRAWQLYATDYDGTFVHNYHAANDWGANPSQSPWASGWLDWGTSSANTNMLHLRDSRYARLAPFLEGIERNVHKCPADIYLSRAQALRGYRERVRSVVMNGTVGEGNAPTGPWDPAIYAQARNYADLNFPGPERTSVFLEEHPDSINDPFLFPPRSASWIDVPAGLHGNVNTVTFADGHIEFHQWRESLRNQRVFYSFRAPPARIGDADISWVSFHSNRHNP